MKQTFQIGGMSCASCSAYIQRTVAGLDGVIQCEVNLLSEKMEVEFDPSLINVQQIMDEVDELGYSAAVYAREEQPQGNTETQALKTRLIWSVSFLVPLMYIAMGEMVGLPLPAFLTGHTSAVWFAGLQLLLLLPILVVNASVFRRGFKNLAFLRPNMDSLIAIGSGAAVVYGIYALVQIIIGLAAGNMELVAKYHMQLYFESAGTILTLVTLGKLLEALSKRRTGDAVKGLMELAPKVCTVQRQGKELKLPTEQVQLGDIVAVRPGEHIPLDGEVVSGNTTVDCAALTGESMPVAVGVGDRVSSGTVNLSGYITFRVLQTAGHTTLDKIIELVEKASSTKASAARLADKISAVFTPVVMGLALLSGLVWLLLGRDFAFVFQIAISVLVISCPCALGLATPVAIMVGIGRGAEKGVLFKSVESVEHLCQTHTVVFDKTGTLTVGHPEIVQVTPQNGLTADELLRIAASLEQRSEHPLAGAVVAAAKEQGVTLAQPESFLNHAGRGVSASVDGTLYLLGNMQLMLENGVSVASLSAEIAEHEKNGATPMLLASNGQLMGALFAADALRSGAADVVRALQHRHIQTVMLTGDRQAVAQHVAQQLGIDRVVAEVLPDGKENEIRRLKANGRIAMVGDGINDAPSLCSADVGIAVGAGTDIAMDAADVVLINSEPKTILSAIELSCKIMGNIKGNLFWAFFYNCIGIPVAAGVLIPFGITLNPMLAAAAMSLSSLFVVLNALRLKHA